MKKETYSMALSTDWYSLDSSRSERYVSPTASAMSTTSTSGDVFSPISGDGHSSQNNYETQQYPSPPASDSQEVKLSYMSSPPDQPYPPSGTILPDQPAFSMRDFEFSVNSDDEDAEGEDDETIAPVVEEDAISEEDNTNITTETQRQARTQVNDSDEEEGDATTRAASPVLDESDTDYKPAAQALRTPRRSTTKRISPLKDPDKSRVNKSSRKSKSKPRRSKTASSSPNKSDKLFPCPFAPFGCTAVFPVRLPFTSASASASSSSLSHPSLSLSLAPCLTLTPPSPQPSSTSPDSLYSRTKTNGNATPQPNTSASGIIAATWVPATKPTPAALPENAVSMISIEKIYLCSMLDGCIGGRFVWRLVLMLALMKQPPPIRK